MPLSSLDAGLDIEVWTAQWEADLALWELSCGSLRKGKETKRSLPDLGRFCFGPDLGIDRGFAPQFQASSPESIRQSGARVGSRVRVSSLIQPGPVRWSSCESKLGQHNSLLVLVFALAIRIADLTGFIGAKEQNLAQPFVGINLGR
jgi:hypothetical protein